MSHCYINDTSIIVCSKLFLDFEYRRSSEIFLNIASIFIPFVRQSLKLSWLLSFLGLEELL